MNGMGRSTTSKHLKQFSLPFLLTSCKLAAWQMSQWNHQTRAQGLCTAALPLKSDKNDKHGYKVEKPCPSYCLLMKKCSRQAHYRTSKDTIRKCTKVKQTLIKLSFGLTNWRRQARDPCNQQVEPQLAQAILVSGAGGKSKWQLFSYHIPPHDTHMMTHYAYSKSTFQILNYLKLNLIMWRYIPNVMKG